MVAPGSSASVPEWTYGELLSYFPVLSGPHFKGRAQKPQVSSFILTSARACKQVGDDQRFEGISRLRVSVP